MRLKRCRVPSFWKSLWSLKCRNHCFWTRDFGNRTSWHFCVQAIPHTSFQAFTLNRSQVPWSKETQASQPIPILVGYPSPGLWPGRTSVPLFPHAVFAVGLSSALNTSLRWLEHGDVLRSYEFFKVQGAGEKLRDTVGEDQNPRNLPLIKHVERRGVFSPPPLFEKMQK